MTTPVARTYYTPETIAVLNENIRDHAWARKERDAILKRADRWLQYSDDKLLTMVPPPDVPRAFDPHKQSAPVKGAELRRRGVHAWVVDFDRPWKIKNPVDGVEYPSNDFEAFLKSGMKDRSLLTGPYPDDGWGCHVEGEKAPFWFIAYYAHESVRRFLLPALRDLSRAYLITNDAKYAHACGLLLWRMAEYYPRYDYNKQSRYAKEFYSGYQGRMLNWIWEAVWVATDTPPAYDAVRPALDADEALLKRAGMTGPALREFIETRILRTMANDVMGPPPNRIRGNFGMHQVALLRIARVLDGRPGAPDAAAMREWVLNNPAPNTFAVAGMEDALYNLVNRDGYPFESLGYNIHWVVSLTEMAEELGEAGERIMALPRFRKLYTWMLKETMIGDKIPSYGDAGNLYHRCGGWNPKLYESVFRRTKDPVFGAALTTYCSRGGQDLFKPGLDADLAKARDAFTGRLGVDSQLMPALGFASLQTGNEANRTGVALLYGQFFGHSHADGMQMDLYSWNHALTPDFGYPETAEALDPRREGWICHNVTHNTVMINERKQEKARGRLHLYDRGPFVQVVEASSEACYPGLADLYHRTLLLVEMTPEQAYLVDIFRVRGGDRHDWIVHGTDAAFESDIPFSAPRKQGTLAGENVVLGDYYDDARYANWNEKRLAYGYYRGSGFQFLFNVQEAAPGAGGTATWRCRVAKPEGVALRAHLLGGDDQLIACDGQPQRRTSLPETVKFLLRRRSGKGLESVFVTVFEPYKDKPFLDSVSLLPVESKGDMPVALSVTSGGKRHTLFHRLEDNVSPSAEPTTFASDGAAVNARCAVLERSGGETFSRVYLLDDRGSAGLGGQARDAERRVVEVADVDYAAGRIGLREAVSGALPAGAVGVVESDRHATALFAAHWTDARTFNVGDDDLIAGRIRVAGVEGRAIRYTPPFMFYYVEPGMGVVSESGRFLGRVHELDSKAGTLVLDRDIPASALADADGDGQQLCRVMAVSPGDRIIFHGAARLGGGE